MNLSNRFIGIVICTIALNSCNQDVEISKFDRVFNQIHEMQISDLEDLASKGHLGALTTIAIRSCSSPEHANICIQSLEQASERGDPVAMDWIATILAGDSSDQTKLYEAYIRAYEKQFFYRNQTLSSNGYVRSFQEMEKHNDEILISYIESIFSSEEIIKAKNEASYKAHMAWQKLQEYCEEWKDQDYVCLYQFTPPSHD